MYKYNEHDIKFRPFSRATSANVMQQILNNDFVAKMTGFPYGDYYHELVPAIDSYIEDNDTIIEVHLQDREQGRSRLVGFIGFARPNTEYLITLMRRGIFGKDINTAKAIARLTTQISYFLDPEYIGQGIGTQMVRKAIDRKFASTKNPCACIIATYGIFDDYKFKGPNMASKNLLEKMGFEYLKTYRRDYLISGDTVDLACNYLMNPRMQKYLEEKNLLPEERQ